MTTENGGSTPVESLPGYINPPSKTSGEFTLTPTFDMVVDQYVEMDLSKEATEIYQAEQDVHPEIFTKKKHESKSHFERRKNIKTMMGFVQNAFVWKDGERLATNLNTNPMRVLLKGYTGPRKHDRAVNFQKRLKGMFTITSILERYVDEAIDRRSAIANVNGLISDIRMMDIMKAGKFNAATCITQETVRHWSESNSYQAQQAYIGKHQDTPNPDETPVGLDYIEPEGLRDSDDFQEGPLDNEFA